MASTLVAMASTLVAFWSGRFLFVFLCFQSAVLVATETHELSTVLRSVQRGTTFCCCIGGF